MSIIMMHLVKIALLVLLVDQQLMSIDGAKMRLCPVYVTEPAPYVDLGSPLNGPCAAHVDCARGLRCNLQANPPVCILAAQPRLENLPLRSRFRVYLRDIIMEDILATAFEFFEKVRSQQQKTINNAAKTKQ